MALNKKKFKYVHPCNRKLIFAQFGELYHFLLLYRVMKYHQY